MPKLKEPLFCGASVVNKVSCASFLERRSPRRNFGDESTVDKRKNIKKVSYTIKMAREIIKKPSCVYVSECVCVCLCEKERKREQLSF